MSSCEPVENSPSKNKMSLINFCNEICIWCDTVHGNAFICLRGLAVDDLEIGNKENHSTKRNVG
jgi:hypothetical protein